MSEPHRIAAIRKTLYPTDPTYCAEPLDIEDARFLLNCLAVVERERQDCLDALIRIEDGDSDCGCTHDTEDCCERVGVYCPRCIAAGALANRPDDKRVVSDSEPPTSSQRVNNSSS